MSPRQCLLPMEPGFTPRECQTEATRAFQFHAKLGTKRTLMQLATGSGKGQIIAGLLTKCAWAGKRGLFIVNRDFLLDDVYKRTLAVEPAMYAGRVKGRINECDRPTVFASLQTVSNEERCRALGRIDWVAIDEAHGLLCPSGITLVNTLVDVNPNVRFTGFTATAYRAAQGGKTTGLGALFGPDVGGLDEPIYTYSLADGIRDGVLCPIRGVRMPPLFDRTRTDPDDEIETARVLDTDDHNEAVVRAYIEHRPGPGIAFCTDVGHAIHLAEMFQKHGIRAEAVWETSTKTDARTGKRYGKCEDRDRKIEAALSGDVEVLTNMTLLSTGFDWKACRIMMSVAPTNSAVLWPQEVGRITRYLPGKEGIVLDFVDNTLMHDLGLGADFSLPVRRIKMFEVGDVVRHRYDVARSEGFVSETDGTRYRVEWRGGLGSDWYAVDDLVLVRKRRERETITVSSRVVGLDAIHVELIRGNRDVPWYRYTASETVRKVAVKRVTMTISVEYAGSYARVQVRNHGNVYQVWSVAPVDVNGKKTDRATLERPSCKSEEDACEAAAAMVKERGGRIVKRVATEPRSNQQAGFLKHMGQRNVPETMSNAEAAMLADSLTASRAIADKLDPGRVSRRAFAERERMAHA